MMTKSFLRNGDRKLKVLKSSTSADHLTSVIYQPWSVFEGYGERA
jgi:hypothetical protein